MSTFEVQGVSSASFLLHAVGDIGIVGRIAESLGNVPSPYPFQEVAQALATADLVFGNLEIPFSGGAPIVVGESPKLETPEASLERLRAAGFHVLSLANNHVMDFGATGLETTLRLLDSAGIRSVGAGRNLAEARRPVIVERRGTRVGFLAYCVPCHATATEERAGAAPLEIGVVREDLATLRPQVDCAIVSVHFGMMYLEHPTPDDMQLARSIVAAGADVVIGHHPHVLQGIEQVSNAIIAYSLGEFVFDPQAGNYYARVARETRRRSLIFRAAIEGRAVSLLEPIPTLAGDDLTPRVLHGRAAADALDSVKGLSAALADPTVRSRFWDYAGKELFEYQMSGAWFEIRRGNLLRLLSRLPRIRLRHLKLVLGYLRSILAGASTTR